jgi:hypothetical protein
MTGHAGIIDLFVCLVLLVGIVCTTRYGPEGGTAPGGFTVVTDNGAKHGAAGSSNGSTAHDTVGAALRALRTGRTI